jgi:hypothetical protein
MESQGMAVLGITRWATLIAFVALVGCTGQNNAPTVIRLDSSDEKKPQAEKAGAAPNVSAVPAPPQVSRRASANVAPDNLG